MRGEGVEVWGCGGVRVWGSGVGMRVRGCEGVKGCAGVEE